MTATAPKRVVVLLALLGALIAAQYAAVMTAPAGYRTDSGTIARTTGTAYLTGLRRFAAAVLWNRIDPVMHEYYKGLPVAKLTFAVPSLVAVVWLDPHLENASYLLPWMLARNGRTSDALRMVDRTVADNPRSGLMLSGGAQIYELYGGDPRVAEDLAVRALSATWPDDSAKWNGLSAARQVLIKRGRTAEAAQALRLMKRIEAAHPEGVAPRDDDE